VSIGAPVIALAASLRRFVTPESYPSNLHTDDVQMYGRQSVWQRPDRDKPEPNPGFNLLYEWL